jgi:stage V sporulation protein AD
MSKILGKRTMVFENPPYIVGYGAVGSKFEKEGPLGEEFDQIFENPIANAKTWEMAESELRKSALGIAIEKSNKKAEQIDFVFAGDLLNQCTGSTFGVMDFGIPFLGVYGACSTMALTLIMASVFMESKIGKTVAAVTSSHFCSAEKQYRFPLEYGNQRPQNAQWTATASGAVILTDVPQKVKIFSATVGKVCDKGITDPNNMGAAMAPDDVKIRPYPSGVGAWSLDSF